MIRFATTLLLIALAAVSACSGDRSEYTRPVDPFIGTGGHGHTYPGACLPFGMVQLSPDTRLTGWDGCSAYHFSDNVVFGFSHTHLSGTGCSDYGDILVMPTVGTVRLTSGGADNPGSGYCSRFRHKKEEASPGYYRVFLDDYRITVELTVTKRAGLHRYTFPKSKKANVIIDLEHRDPVTESFIRVVSETEIEGFRRSTAWAKDQHLYFVAKFSRPFDSYGLAVDDKIRRDADEASGTNVKGYVTFETGRRDEILVKVGISAVDVEGARRNLDSEIPGWDFETVRKRADREWNEALSKIVIKGGSKDRRTIFYTSLYHTMLAPNLFMDVDHRYRGRDLEIHEAEDYEYYTVFSLWDTYRAAHPLFTIIEPERTVDFIKTFIAQYEQGGALPIWELAANETECMIGYHAAAVIADAFIKGMRGFDVATAFEAMKQSAERDYRGLEFYRAYGYIPGDKEAESVSKTLEYAYDDWCIAQVARELGRRDDYRRYIERAQYYKNIFDPSTGFMRAKMNGRWVEPFDPAEVNFHYTEANSWQYSFYVPQDIRGLIELMGGASTFALRLDSLFAAGSATTGRNQADITGLIGQYAHGNEPSHHMAYLYSYANRPWKTQERVRRIMDELYRAAPAGLCGNEDCGQMSAWYVLSALGFYPVTPGQTMYVIGTPLFPEASIDVGNGRRFIVTANKVSDKNIYIQSARLNGKPYERSYIEHGAIMGGGRLVFEMGPVPNRAWGSGEDAIPVSAITDHPILPVPYVVSGERSFFGSTEVTLASVTDGAKIFYSTGGSEAIVGSMPYTGPFRVGRSVVINAFAVKEGLPASLVVTSEFTRAPKRRSIELGAPYSPMYTGGGDVALVDYIRGSRDFRTGAWQGYQGVDLDAVVDLGGLEVVRRISTGFLQDQNSWIFMPVEVEYSISDDRVEFSVVAVVRNNVPERQEGAIVKEFTVRGVDRDARYVRIKAKNRGICPDWHKGAGRKAWIFADEIVIE